LRQRQGVQEVTDESNETQIALLKHRVKLLEDDNAAMKGWGIKAALAIIGTLAMTSWDKIQSFAKVLSK
jgi:hypothetical protein